MHPPPPLLSRCGDGGGVHRSMTRPAMPLQCCLPPCRSLVLLAFTRREVVNAEEG